MIAKTAPEQWFVRLPIKILEGPFGSKAEADREAKKHPGSAVFLAPVLADVDLSEVEFEDLQEGHATQYTSLRIHTDGGLPYMIVTESMAQQLAPYFVRSGLPCRVTKRAAGTSEKAEDLIEFETQDLPSIEAVLALWRHEQSKKKR
jgi:hypothetical protein